MERAVAECLGERIISLDRSLVGKGVGPQTTDVGEFVLVDGASHVASHGEQLGIPLRTVFVDEIERLSFDSGDEASSNVTAEAGGLMGAEADEGVALIFETRHEAGEDLAHTFVERSS